MAKKHKPTRADYAELACVLWESITLDRPEVPLLADRGSSYRASIERRGAPRLDQLPLAQERALRAALEERRG